MARLVPGLVFGLLLAWALLLFAACAPAPRIGSVVEDCVGHKDVTHLTPPTEEFFQEWRGKHSELRVCEAVRRGSVYFVTFQRRW